MSEVKQLLQYHRKKINKYKNFIYSINVAIKETYYCETCANDIDVDDQNNLIKKYARLIVLHSKIMNKYDPCSHCKHWQGGCEMNGQARIFCKKDNWFRWRGDNE